MTEEERNNRQVTAILVVSVLAVAAVASFYMVFTNFLVTGMTASGDIGDPAEAYMGADMQGYAGGDYYLGSADAPVTMIEYSDFECPYCGRFYSETLPQIEQNYVGTGDVKLVYRNFPLPFHSSAMAAAEAAECAGEQGKFWEMQDKLYTNQDALSRDNYIRWAGDLGIDTIAFGQCIDSGRYRTEIQLDKTEGEDAGVTGTPTFFINGRKVVGAQPYSVFQQAIEGALAQA